MAGGAVFLRGRMHAETCFRKSGTTKPRNLYEL